jgi:uncharacterized protein (TIGR00645 family)
MRSLVKFVEGTIFWSRWLQAPLYLGLIVAQGVYVYRFLVELLHLVQSATHLSEDEVILIVLGLIDLVMIANLMVMIIIGGYETFVSRLDLENHPDQPEWLSHMNAGVLKVKRATSLIGISSIHLLEIFIKVPQLSDKEILWKIAIHLVFVISALFMAYTDKVMSSTVQSLKRH